MKLLTFLFLFISFHLTAQDLSGVWKGTCNWENKSRDLTLIINKPNGTLYKGRGIERGSYYTTTFDFEFFCNGTSGVIQAHKITNIKCVDGNGKTLKVSRKATGKDGDNCISLCDDSFSFVFGYDNKFNYFEAVCSENLVSWSLGQNRKTKVITP